MYYQTDVGITGSANVVYNYGTNGISITNEGSNPALSITGNDIFGTTGNNNFLNVINSYSGATASTKTFLVSLDGVYQIGNSSYVIIFELDDNGNMKIPGTLTLNNGISYQSYSGFENSSDPIISTQNGHLIKMIGNITLPTSSSVSLGGKFNFINQQATTYTITVAESGTESIYNGTTNETSITVEQGETLELTSNGGVEWYVTNGTTGIRYQKYPSITRNSYVNLHASYVTYNTILAFMGNGDTETAGALYLGTTISTIDVIGQSLWLLNASGSNIQIISGTLTTTAANYGGPLITSDAGDTVTATFTDITNSGVYRVTGQQLTSSNTGNYSVIIEKIA